MNIQQAKSIPLPDFLSQLGHAPARSSDRELWYLSPLRDERTPSFKVNIQRNQWHDFGSGEKGDVVDLAKKLFQVGGVSSALHEIQKVMQGSTFEPVVSQLSNETPKSVTTINRIGPVRSRVLLSYLADRGIDSAAAIDRLREIHYSRDGRSFFALGFQNDGNGYELRNRLWKGTLGQKTISTRRHKQSDRGAVFEGFSDYLTAIARDNSLLDENAIVMNSVAMLPQTLARINELEPRRIDLWLDNDSAGRNLVSQICEAFPGLHIVDHAQEYQGFSDLNEWHVTQKGRQR